MIITFCLFTVGCGSDKVINGKLYETYGLINRDNVKSSNVKYKVIVGNVIWGILLCETIIAPIYFFGFSIQEPVCEVSECNN